MARDGGEGVTLIVLVPDSESLPWPQYRLEQPGRYTAPAGNSAYGPYTSWGLPEFPTPL